MGPELRVDWSKGMASFDGYALVYGATYEVYGGPPFGWDETVMAGAAAGNVNDDVRLLVNHDGLPMARTTSGTMTLASDGVGLRARAPSLDLRNPQTAELASAADRGDVTQMSFAFRVGRQEWNGDFTERRILSFDEIVDVSAVTFPASPSTSFTVGDSRSLLLVDDFDDDEIENARARAAASASRLRYVTRRDPMKMSEVEARVRRVVLS